MINVTDKEHKDFERLNQALEKIKKVVASVNDSKELEEEMEAMAKIIERLQGTEVRKNVSNLYGEILRGSICRSLRCRWWCLGVSTSRRASFKKWSRYGLSSI